MNIATVCFHQKGRRDAELDATLPGCDAPHGRRSAPSHQEPRADAENGLPMAALGSCPVRALGGDEDPGRPI